MSEKAKVLLNEIISIVMFSVVAWAVGAANTNIFLCGLGWCITSAILYQMRRNRNG